MPGQVVKYQPIAQGERLRQGEILAGLVQIRQSLASIGTDGVDVDEITHPLLVVMTQDCDLEQDWEARTTQIRANQDASLLNDPDFKKKHDNAPKCRIQNILFCEVMTTVDMKNGVPPGKDIWKRIIQNKDERYHCLEAVPAQSDARQLGLDSLGCDFKRFSTVPADELYKRLSASPDSRRCRLVTPYAEHLRHRFCHFLGRIPLPENHEVPM